MDTVRHGYQSLCNRVIEEFDNDLDLATEHILRLASNDAALFKWLAATGARAALRKGVRGKRDGLWSSIWVEGTSEAAHPAPSSLPIAKTPTVSTEPQEYQAAGLDTTPSHIPVTRQNEMAQNYALSWMDYPLSNGMKISEATKQDLLAESQMMIRQGREMVFRGMWMSRIADRVPFGKTVAEVLTEEQVKTLMLEAKNAA